MLLPRIRVGGVMRVTGLSSSRLARTPRSPSTRATVSCALSHGSYTVEHAGDRSPVEIHSNLQRTIREAIEVARTAAPEQIAPAYFGPMKLGDMVITRVVEALVHGIDLRTTDSQEYATHRWCGETM